MNLKGFETCQSSEPKPCEGATPVGHRQPWLATRNSAESVGGDHLSQLRIASLRLRQALFKMEHQAARRCIAASLAERMMWPQSGWMLACLRLSVVAAQVTVTFRPHWVHVLPGRATEQAVVLDVLAPEVTGRPPAQELALLLDVSLSMAEGGKLDLAKAVAERIIRSLRPEDRIHLISCQSFARLEFQHGSLEMKGHANLLCIAKTSQG
ncbi:unnamed protein product [Symbiodinium sp. KB8]|nr:unnamed protein product [Symbiodinium sp. KB8]